MANRACAEIARRAIRYFSARQIAERTADDNPLLPRYARFAPARGAPTFNRAASDAPAAFGARVRRC